jgi:hypothetical protein
VHRRVAVGLQVLDGTLARQRLDLGLQVGDVLDLRSSRVISFWMNWLRACCSVVRNCSSR